MPNSIIKTYTVNGKTPWIPLDRFTPNKTFMVKDVGGGATFTMEHLLADPQASDFDGDTTTHFILDENINASSGESSAIGSSGSMAVRLDLTGASEVVFTITQGGC